MKGTISQLAAIVSKGSSVCEDGASLSSYPGTSSWTVIFSASTSTVERSREYHHARNASPSIVPVYPALKIFLEP